MSLYLMKIREHFIQMILDGIKKREYRLNTLERRNIKIGDILVLISNQDSKKYVKVKVSGKKEYNNWDEALENYWDEDFKNLFETRDEVLKECYRFYTKDEVINNGIVVFDIVLFNNRLKNSRVLLDTNIIIGRESFTDVSYDVSMLYRWIDKLHMSKFIHPKTIEEISNYNDERIKQSILTKINSYDVLVPIENRNAFFDSVVEKYSNNENSKIDNKLLFQSFSGNVDFFITDDKALLSKAKELFLSDVVFSTHGFLNIIEDEYPSLIDYDVLSVRKEKIGSSSIYDEFFDSLRELYGGLDFNNWLIKKSNEDAYVFKEKDKLQGFLYLKYESEDENYEDINPIFVPKKRLKVGTFKINSTGMRLGERFLKIIFDNAIKGKVDEIYVTLFENKKPDIDRLKSLFLEWGFYVHGYKSTGEIVLVKNMTKYDLSKSVKYNYPLVKTSSVFGFMPIEPDFHTKLFPDLFLKNENMNLYFNSPCSYALEKVYVCGWKKDDIKYKSGDLLLIYRKGIRQPKKYSSVVSGIVILEDIFYPSTLEEFLKICNRRTVFSEQELKKFYLINKYRTIVKVLFYKSFKNKVILDDLWYNGIVEKNSGPRLTTLLNENQYNLICDLGLKEKL